MMNFSKKGRERLFNEPKNVENLCCAVLHSTPIISIHHKIYVTMHDEDRTYLTDKYVEAAEERSGGKRPKNKRIEEEVHTS